MIHVETAGTWNEMGRQYGEATAVLLRKAIGYFGQWMIDDGDKSKRIANVLRSQIETIAPELVDETEGMSVGSGLPVDAVYCLRFLPEVSSIVRTGCTVVLLRDTDKGPILARNQDIEPDVSVEMQVRQIRRPIDRPASVVMTYAGFVAGTGFNANGVGVGATSAHSIHPDGKGNLPFSLFFHLLLQQCASVDDFINRFSEQTYYGKTVVGLMADAGGSSAGFEMNPGSPLTFVPRRQDRDWQAYTNHYQKSVEQIAPEVEYLQNSYARYGRLLHRLAEVPIARTAAELRQLMTEVAEPGLVVSPKDLSFPTAYTTFYYLKHGRATVLDGHPSKAQPVEVRL